jgi:spermidine synthase
MPTQVLSGRLPVALARARVASPEVGVVGLASGVTAAEALQAGAARVTVLEIEPAVVRAAALFADVNHGLLDDARAQVIVGDARAWLRRPGPPLDVWISEPSNPWIMGVNNLFTREYWALARARLRPDGVMCQWVQLYSLPPSAFRGLVRTFLDVFPEAWLFETIPGADALLIAAPGPLPPDLPLQPRLDPAGLRRLAGLSRRNTDADPWVEFEAPRWLHRPTAAQNAALIERAAEAP